MTHEIKRLLANICSSDLGRSKAFYLDHFKFELTYDSSWFIHLTIQGSGLEIGIIDKNNDLLPEGFSGKANVLYLTIVIDDVDRFYADINLRSGYSFGFRPSVNSEFQLKMAK